MKIPSLRGYLFDSKTKKISLASAESALFEKELIREGNWWHPSYGWEMDVTTDFLNELVAAFDAMKANGLDVPIPIGHDWNADANTGYVRKLWVAENDAGTQSIFGLLEITEPEIAGKLERGTIRRVSVAIDHEATDGKKNEYGAAIVHVALTSYPVAYEQDDAFLKVDADSVVEAATEIAQQEWEKIEGRFSGKDEKQKVHIFSNIPRIAPMDDIPTLKEVIAKHREEIAPWDDEWVAWEALRDVIWEIKSADLKGDELKTALGVVLDEFEELLGDALERQAAQRLRRGVFSMFFEGFDEKPAKETLRSFAGIVDTEKQEAPDMDLETVLKNAEFAKLCEQLGVDIPDDADEKFVLGVYGLASVANTEVKGKLDSAEAKLEDAEKRVTDAEAKIAEASKAPNKETEFDLVELEKSEDPAIRKLLAQNKEQQEELDKAGKELSGRIKAEQVKLHGDAKAEAEKAAEDGKLNEDGVKAYSALLCVETSKMLVLSAEGAPATDDIDVADMARKLIGSLPLNATLDVGERTVRNVGTEDQTVIIASDPKNAELSGEKVAEHAKRLAASIGQGKE